MRQLSSFTNLNSEVAHTTSTYCAAMRPSSFLFAICHTMLCYRFIKHTHFFVVRPTFFCYNKNRTYVHYVLSKSYDIHIRFMRTLYIVAKSQKSRCQTYASSFTKPLYCILVVILNMYRT